MIKHLARSGKPRTVEASTLDIIEQEVGGRLATVTLLDASDDPRAQRLCAHLRLHEQMSLARACRVLGLTHHDVRKMLASEAVIRAQLQADIIHASAVPRAARDLGVDAHAQDETCSACTGNGSYVKRGKEWECRKCGGTGKVRVPADIKKVALLYQATRIIEQKPVLEQHISFNKAVLTQGSSDPPLEAMAKNLNKALRESNSSVDAELVEAQEK